MNPNQPECLIEDCSPNGNVLAVVEQSADTCYFYLHGDKTSKFGLKSCWVRNLRPAPDKLDVSAMRDGVPPMLPRDFCRHPSGADPLKPSALSVVWAEEGDAAALREHGKIVAIVPSWSGRDGFHGYARDCIGESPLCWELGTPETNVQFERYEKAAAYWRAWTEDANLWPDFQSQMIDVIEKRFGKHSNYYAIDGGKWPPKALLRIPQKDSVLLITVGMALRPQPQVELYYEDPAPHRRIELGILLDGSFSDEAINRIASYLSGQSGYPWSFYTFLGNGHTMPADAFAAVSGGAFPYALLQSQPEGEVEINLPPFRGDPVTVLWITPISERERLFAEQSGSTQLAQKLQKQCCGWRYRLRRSEVV